MLRGGLESIKGRDFPWTLDGFWKFKALRPRRIASSLHHVSIVFVTKRTGFIVQADIFPRSSRMEGGCLVLLKSAKRHLDLVVGLLEPRAAQLLGGPVCLTLSGGIAVGRRTIRLGNAAREIGHDVDLNGCLVLTWCVFGARGGGR